MKVAMCVFNFACVLRLVAILTRSAFVSSFASNSFPTSRHARSQGAKKACAIFIATGGDTMMSLKSLSDQELTGRLRQLVRKEQSLTLSILSYLAEVERRGLHLEKAYSTLSEYCIHELGYGESSAWRRVRAARVIKEIPEVYDLMKANKLSFSAVLQVANVLTPENRKELLPRIELKSKSEIDKIIVEYQAPQAIPDSARPKLVKKIAPVQRALTSGTLKAAGKRASGPELGEISLHSEGKFDPTDKISTHEMTFEKMFEVRFAAD
ncbi:MAG: hypothetical protein PVF33_04680, partial [Candidatus Latescibacterota bacterium]